MELTPVSSGIDPVSCGNGPFNSGIDPVISGIEPIPDVVGVTAVASVPTVVNMPSDILVSTGSGTPAVVGVPCYSSCLFMLLLGLLLMYSFTAVVSSLDSLL